jgi:hypothetical protein
VLIFLLIFFDNSGQVDSQLQVSGSILQPVISGMVRLSHGEAYLPHDKGNGPLASRLVSTKARYASPGYDQMISSGHVSGFLRSLSTSSASTFVIYVLVFIIMISFHHNVWYYFFKENKIMYDTTNGNS